MLFEWHRLHLISRGVCGAQEVILQVFGLLKTLTHCSKPLPLHSIGLPVLLHEVVDKDCLVLLLEALTSHHV